MSEKIHVAKTSAAASTGMTLLKFTVGALTGSLALQAEALHSALDFFATLITWLSVRISDRPADSEHNYGHGKVENLSAFAESIVLLFTCAWLFKHSIEHLRTREVPQFTGGLWYWAAGVVVAAMVVDVFRSARLFQAAAKFRSQALRADAQHFATDLLSSAMVLASLTAMRLGAAYWWADPVAAILVACIILIVAIRLAKQAADVMMDRAPAGLERQMQEIIRRVPGVFDVQRMHHRQSGARTFVDATITVDPSISMKEGHRIANSVELAATEQHPEMDITVHVEPSGQSQSQGEAIQALAAGMNLKLHALRIREIGDHLYVNFHVELPPQMPLKDAHRTVSMLEDRIRLRLPQVAEIDSHLEPAEA